MHHLKTIFSRGMFCIATWIAVTSFGTIAHAQVTNFGGTIFNALWETYPATVLQFSIEFPFTDGADSDDCLAFHNASQISVECAGIVESGSTVYSEQSILSLMFQLTQGCSYTVAPLRTSFPLKLPSWLSADGGTIGAGTY